MSIEVLDGGGEGAYRTDTETHRIRFLLNSARVHPLYIEFDRRKIWIFCERVSLYRGRQTGLTFRKFYIFMSASNLKINFTPVSHLRFKLTMLGSMEKEKLVSTPDIKNFTPQKRKNMQTCGRSVRNLKIVRKLVTYPIMMALCEYIKRRKYWAIEKIFYSGHRVITS